MKVLHVFDHSVPLHSGYSFRSMAILNQLRANGITTVQVTGAKHHPNDDEGIPREGLMFHRTAPGLLSTLPVLNQLDVILGLRNRINQIIKLEQPDIIHAHSPALNGVAALMAGRKHHLPVVYEVRSFWEDAAVDHGTSSEQGLRYKATRTLETHVLQRADAVTCICEGLRQDIVSRGINANKVHVVANAVDATKFTFDQPPSPALAEQYPLAGKTIIGFIGSFYAYEGLDLLVEAMALLDDSYLLLLIGGGSEEGKLKQLVAARGLEQRVLFTGRVPHSDIDGYYNLIELFVYPRKSMRLTELVTPLKPLEAMAKGRLALASNVGGHRELIEHGYNGMLFKPDSPEAIAEAVVDINGRRGDWQTIKSNGRNHVEKQRTWQRSVAVVEDIYNSLLNTTPGSHGH